MTSAPARPVDTLGLAGVLLAVLLWPAGITVSVVALVRSIRAGRVSRPAIVGLVIGILAAAATIVLLVIIVNGFGGLAERCAQLGPGEYRFDDGSILSCG